MSERLDSAYGHTQRLNEYFYVYLWSLDFISPFHVFHASTQHRAVFFERDENKLEIFFSYHKTFHFSSHFLPPSCVSLA